MTLGWMILTSCLGDSTRARISNISFNPRQATFDRNYMRTITSSGEGTWNQIEMDDMLGDNRRHSDDE
ncbi:glutamine amidotransferase type 1 protein [Rutstroemia sp. NJR-2017a WRK4]|nr:glutamine amidotransferase type 1 protein [Rutstroemia sp. NJR-2017a WRK4]